MAHLNWLALIMTSVVLQRETAASLYGDQEHSDVELVFVHEHLAEHGSAPPQQNQPKKKSGKTAKRRREGVNSSVLKISKFCAFRVLDALKCISSH